MTLFLLKTMHLPFFLFMCSLPAIAQAEDIVAFDFHKNQKKGEWQIVNDGVMGGLSESRFAIKAGNGNFSGILSLENNGGFASVRSQLGQMSLDGCDRIILRIRGDGRRYKFNIRTNQKFEGVNYQLSFPTQQGKWELIELPLNKFTPTWRGQVLTNKPKLTGSSIVSLGFLISDKQAGPFKLSIDWIKGRKAE